MYKKPWFAAKVLFDLNLCLQWEVFLGKPHHYQNRLFIQERIMKHNYLQKSALLKASFVKDIKADPGQDTLETVNNENNINHETS